MPPQLLLHHPPQQEQQQRFLRSSSSSLSSSSLSSSFGQQQQQHQQRYDTELSSNQRCTTMNTSRINPYQQQQQQQEHQQQEHYNNYVEEKEISRHEALELLWKDISSSNTSSSTNFYLESNMDGTIHSCHKWYLGARSPVFYRMLFGSTVFQESTQSKIRINYSGIVISSMLEYIYTDQVQFLNQILFQQQDLQEQQQEQQDTVAYTLMSLMDAANYYGLPKLRQMTQDTIHQLLHQNWSMAISFLVVCNNQQQQQQQVSSSTSTLSSPFINTDLIEELCWSVVRSYPKELLLDGHHNNNHNNNSNNLISRLSPNQLERLLQDDKIQANELTLFRLLQVWATAANDNNEEEHDNDDEDRDDCSITLSSPTSSSSSSTIVPQKKKMGHYPSTTSITSSSSLSLRMIQAQYIAYQLQLSTIHPLQLRQIVKPSGIISVEQLCDAYEIQAVIAVGTSRTTSSSSSSPQHHPHHNLTMIHDLPRSKNHRWDLSQNLKFESTAMKHEAAILSSCSGMTVGSIYQWSLYVERDAKFTWLGITTTSSSSASSSSSSSSNLNSSSSSSLLFQKEEEEPSLRLQQDYGGGYDGVIGSSGLSSSSSSLLCTSLTKQVKQSFILNSWVYGSNGSVRQNAQKIPPPPPRTSATTTTNFNNFPTYTEGCTISFCLDLSSSSSSSSSSSGSNGGTLNARITTRSGGNDTTTSINSNHDNELPASSSSSSSPWFQLFTNLNEQLRQKEEEDYNNNNNNNTTIHTDRSSNSSCTIGFVPTVFLKKPGKVHFLGFEPVTYYN